MKKLPGMLLAVIIVFCITSNSSAKPFKHCDGKKWERSERMSIDIDDMEETICYKLKHKKKNKHKGSESCDFESIFKKDCCKIELRVCQTDPPSNHAPEPATLLLFGAGLVGLAVFRKKFKNA